MSTSLIGIFTFAYKGALRAWKNGPVAPPENAIWARPSTDDPWHIDFRSRLSTATTGCIAYLIVDRGELAGSGAHSYSAGDATGGSDEAARFKAPS